MTDSERAVLADAAKTLRAMHHQHEDYDRYCCWCHGQSKWPCEHVGIAEDLEALL